MAVFPIRSCLCWNLRTASYASSIYVIVVAIIQVLICILDIASTVDDNFEIRGSFQALWRRHIWKGFLAANIVMVIAHFVLIGFSLHLINVLKKAPAWQEYRSLKWWVALMIIYTLMELGVACYIWSWYAKNTWRLPYLVFEFLFWLLRAITNVFCIIGGWSRVSELEYEMKYGMKRPIMATKGSVNQSFA